MCVQMYGENTMTRNGDWIQTFSARQFWPVDPRCEDVHIEDIAHSLALQCRFTGHCERFYSVAEHSVRLSRLLPQDLALWGLLHDASEAYMTDLSRPLKRSTVLGAEYQVIEKRLMEAICRRFGLPEIEPPEVKFFDNVMLMTEKRDLMRAHGALPKWIETSEPLEETIEPWAWESAEIEFLLRFDELTK